MEVVYVREELPDKVSKTIFLAGPTPRSLEVPTWRNEALACLESLGYDGHVFIPENREASLLYDFDDSIDWELKACSRSDVILFWIPRNMKDMPGLTTNVEFGYWLANGNCVLGAPPEAVSIRYLSKLANNHNTPVCTSLLETCEAALNMIGEGYVRHNGAQLVPLNVWKTDSFQSWYNINRKAGNVLLDFKLEFQKTIKGNVFAWTAAVSIFSKEEGRIKDNEFVFSRTPLVNCVVYYDSPEGLKFILVKELRSNGMSSNGKAYSLVGGSGNDDYYPLEVLLNEIKEEINLLAEVSRIENLGCRQLVSGIIATQVDLFSYKLNPQEFETLANDMNTYGNEEDTERTQVSVHTIEDLMGSTDIDVVTLGACLQVYKLNLEVAKYD